MKAFIKQYWRSAIYYTVLLLLIWCFDTEDYSHYLRQDYKAFVPKANLTLGILMALYICALLIRGRREIKYIKHAPGIFLYLAFQMTFIYFFFHTPFANIALSINRQYSGSKINKAFVVSYIPVNGTFDKQHPFSISTLNGDEYYLDQLFENYPKPQGNKLADTVQVTFTKGLFGVAYLDK